MKVEVTHNTNKGWYAHIDLNDTYIEGPYRPDPESAVFALKESMEEMTRLFNDDGEWYCEEIGYED